MGELDINNQAAVANQANIQNNTGDIYFSQKSRLARRFEKLKEEVEKDIRYDDFIEDLKRYNTKIDGKDMPEKLKDGGFSKDYIIRATYKKHLYSKKLERNKLYESAQRIDLEIFAKISFDFETYIEPLIENGADTSLIKQYLNEKVVQPILNLLNQEGQYDTFLNYTADDILGMIFFLTGKCHLNWANYDNL